MITETLLALAITGANCSTGVCAPVQVRRVAVKNVGHGHVAKQQVQRQVHAKANVQQKKVNNFVDPDYIRNDFYGFNGHNSYGYGRGNILYLAGQNLQTELIVKEAVREAVKSGVQDGVSSGVAEAMRLLRDELLRGQKPAPAPDPKQPDYFEEPIRTELEPKEYDPPTVSIQSTCTRCHEGKNGAPQYTGEIGRLQAHKAALAIMDGSMPKGRDLTEEEKAILIHEFYSLAQ